MAPFSYRGALDASIHRVALVKSVGDTVGAHRVVAAMWRIGAGYFRVMKIPMREGPGFTGHEDEDYIKAYPNNGPVDAVIDEALAYRLFPHEDPVGKVIGVVPPGMRIVGVVAAVEASDLTTPTDDGGAIYFMSGKTLTDVTYVVRSRGSFAQTVAMLREAVRETEASLPLFDIAALPRRGVAVGGAACAGVGNSHRIRRRLALPGAPRHLCDAELQHEPTHEGDRHSARTRRGATCGAWWRGTAGR